MKSYDLTGKKFHRLTGIERVENLTQYGQSRWLFMCDCGTKKEIFGFLVVHERVKSCGCLAKEKPSRLRHGMAGTPVFNSWVSMRQRCLNKNCKAYPEYGGRGITICDEWDSFERFQEDMGPRPAGSSIDRIDNSAGYSPGNCKWSTPVEQVRNRRTTMLYQWAGVELPLQSWAEAIGIKYSTLWARYKAGKRGNELLSATVGPGGRPMR